MSVKNKLRDMPYRGKLLLTILAVVTIVVLVMSVLMFRTAARQSASASLDTLSLFTQQTLTHFVSSITAAERSIHTQYMASGAPSRLPLLRSATADSPAYLLAVREVKSALYRMVSSGAYFDYGMLRMDDTGALIDCGAADRQGLEGARWLFDQEEYRENTYNTCLWRRLDDGSLWVIRDIYNPSPLRHLAKVALRVQQGILLPDLQGGNGYPGQVLLCGGDGALLTATDRSSPLLEKSADILAVRGDVWYDRRQAYAVTKEVSGQYTAIGLLPQDRVNAVHTSVQLSTMLAALTGIILGIFSAWAISRHMTRQMGSLVNSMNEVAAGNLDVTAPVRSRDEIGLLAEHFNGMTAKTKELLGRLIREEKSKQQAEYQNLEYQYRFLQWQVNPHFIYNALEVVNAMAKIDGDDELSRIIIELSAYFRQNARSTQRRFITVEQEFGSLRHYTEIYQSIYSSTYDTDFICEGDTAAAYIPTMILQPLVENALVHGRGPAGDVSIRLTSSQQGGRLIIRLADDGPGMGEETIRQLFSPDQPDEGRGHLGIRNVQQRLKLLFGSKASLRFTCPPEGGTIMIMELPLSYAPPAEQLRPDQPTGGAA